MQRWRGVEKGWLWWSLVDVQVSRRNGRGCRWLRVGRRRFLSCFLSECETMMRCEEEGIEKRTEEQRRCKERRYYCNGQREGSSVQRRAGTKNKVRAPFPSRSLVVEIWAWEGSLCAADSTGAGADLRWGALGNGRNAASAGRCAVCPSLGAATVQCRPREVLEPVNLSPCRSRTHTHRPANKATNTQCWPVILVELCGSERRQQRPPKRATISLCDLSVRKGPVRAKAGAAGR